MVVNQKGARPKSIMLPEYPPASVTGYDIGKVIDGFVKVVDRL